MAPEPMTAFVAGIGSGKTIAGCLKGLMASMGQPGMRTPNLGMVVTPTYPMMRDATLRVWHEQCGAWIHSMNKSDLVARMYNGSEVLFRSADDPERLRGPSLSWVYLDEAALCDDKVWDISLGRLRQFGQMGRIWLTTTPKGRNWVWELFENKKQPGYRLFRATTKDNIFVGPEFLENLRNTYGVGLWARQELEGEFVVAEGAIFDPAWFRIVGKAPDGIKWVRFWDLAASSKETADYTAGALVGHLDGTLYIAVMKRGQWEWPRARRTIEETALADGASVPLGVETAGFQLATFQELLDMPSLVGHTIRAARPDKDKVSRALPWQARAEAGKVALVDGPWVEEFLAEAAEFPEGRHDDQIDAVSGAVAMLRDLVLAEMQASPNVIYEPEVVEPVLTKRQKRWRRYEQEVADADIG